jgi:hypothetical protein
MTMVMITLRIIIHDNQKRYGRVCVVEKNLSLAYKPTSGRCSLIVFSGNVRDSSAMPGWRWLAGSVGGADSTLQNDWREPSSTTREGGGSYALVARIPHRAALTTFLSGRVAAVVYGAQFTVCHQLLPTTLQTWLRATRGSICGWADPGSFPVPL